MCKLTRRWAAIRRVLVVAIIITIVRRKKTASTTTAAMAVNATVIITIIILRLSPTDGVTITPRIARPLPARGWGLAHRDPPLATTTTTRGKRDATSSTTSRRDRAASSAPPVVAMPTRIMVTRRRLILTTTLLPIHTRIITIHHRRIIHLITHSLPFPRDALDLQLPGRRLPFEPSVSNNKNNNSNSSHFPPRPNLLPAWRL